MPVEKLGTRIKAITGPWGVAVNKKGEMVIVEECCISIYGYVGEKKRSFGSQGRGRGELLGPRGVAVDNGDNILVADSENNRIQKLTADETS